MNIFHFMKIPITVQKTLRKIEDMCNTCMAYTSLYIRSFFLYFLTMRHCAENGDTIQDIEDHCKTFPSNYTWKDLRIPQADYDIHKSMLYDLTALLDSGVKPPAAKRQIQQSYHRAVKTAFMNQIYQNEMKAGAMKRNIILENAMITSKCRGISGVSVLTVFLSPYPEGQAFSCKWNCSYCPNEPGQPRSYLFGEPGVLRANQHGFDCVKQMLARIKAYQVNGHPDDKFEVLILGGTIASYPKTYLETFMRDIFYAANVCSVTEDLRPALSLAEEKALNAEGSTHRVIGITIETRPDCVSVAELHDFRRWGVTRVQLGVQHTDDAVLRGVNRGCGHKHTLRVLKLLKDNCFKVDIHIMPNLPGASVASDKDMMDCVLGELHPDQVKVYPCTTTPFTKILEDYKTGAYKPYDNDALTEVVLYWKARVHPWIRNNRIVRDIPNSYIVAGVKTSSQRLDFKAEADEKGIVCWCIRCREAGRHPKARAEEGELVTRHYKAQDGHEIFLSWESKNRAVLFGFLRLRFIAADVENVAFPELTGAALVRELHVYGRTIAVGEDAADSAGGKTAVAQHLGIGRRLLAEAERLAALAEYRKIAVISGVGVRKYYEGSGYMLAEGSGEFMMKNINPILNKVMMLYIYILVATMSIMLLLWN